MDERTNNTELVAAELVDDEPKKAGRPKGSTKKVVDNSSFLRNGGHEFDKIIKASEKAAIKVMERLAKIVEDEDSTNSEIVKASDIFLSTLEKMVQQRNKDEITRKIAEVRVNNGIGSGSTGEDEDNYPELDFDKVPDEFSNTVTPTQEEILEQTKKEI